MIRVLVIVALAGAWLACGPTPAVDQSAEDDGWMLDPDSDTRIYIDKMLDNPIYICSMRTGACQQVPTWLLPREHEEPLPTCLTEPCTPT